MVATAPDLDAGDDHAVASDRAATASTSRWQKVVGILGLVVVLEVGDRISNVIFGSGLGPVGDRIGDVIFGSAGGSGDDGGGGHTPGPPEGGHG